MAIQMRKKPEEWQDAFDSVLQHMGTDRAAFLLEKLYQEAIVKHVPIQRLIILYLDTISVEEQPPMPVIRIWSAVLCADPLECLSDGTACQ